MRARTKAVMGVLAVVTAGLVASAPTASSAPNTKSYAYGFSANGEGKQPYVESTDGSTQQGGGNIPENPLIYGDALGLTAGDDFASVRATDLTVGAGAAMLPQELKDGFAQLQAACQVFEQASDANQAVDPLNDAIDQLPAGAIIEIPTAEEAAEFCGALLDADILNLAEVGLLHVECEGDSGSVTLQDVKVLGAPAPGPLVGEVEQDTELLPAELAPALAITLNRQTQHDDGSYTVDGVVISLGGGQGELVLASTTCGEPIATTPTVLPEEELPPAAPAPRSVRRNVPVTG